MIIFLLNRIERRIRVGCGGGTQEQAWTIALRLLYEVVYRDANYPTWHYIEGASLVKTMSKRFMDKAPRLLFVITSGIIQTWSEEMSADKKAHYCLGVADLIPMLLR